MKRLSRITSLALSALMVMLSVITAYAVDTIGTAETATVSNVERMSMVEAPYPFEFVVASTEENEATISFVPGFSSGYTFYLGVKGEKTEILKINRTQYIVEADVEYAFVYTYTVGDEMTVYNGTLIVKTNEDDEITVTPTNVVKNITYAGDITSEMINSNSLAGMRAAGTVWESENNNVMSNADITYDDYDNYGYISSLNDVDWWKIEFDEGGMANFWLGNIPYECDYDLYLYDEYSTGDSDYLATSQNFHGVSELIQYSVEAGVKYYVKINTYDEFSNSSAYLFRAKNYPTVATPSITINFSSNVPSGTKVYIYRENDTGVTNMMVPNGVPVSGNSISIQSYSASWNGASETNNITIGKSYAINIVAQGKAVYVIHPFTIPSSGNYSINVALSDKNIIFSRPFPTYTAPSIAGCQNYGYRYDNNVPAQREFHNGVDISETEGIPIYSISNGTVTYYQKSYSPSQEEFVNVSSGTNQQYFIQYVHLQAGTGLSTGTTVTTDTIIGNVGTTGNVLAHLHIRTEYNSVSVDPNSLFD